MVKSDKEILREYENAIEEEERNYLRVMIYAKVNHESNIEVITRTKDIQMEIYNARQKRKEIQAELRRNNKK